MGRGFFQRRVALASALAIANSGAQPVLHTDAVSGDNAALDVVGPLEPVSVQAENVAFLEAHLDEFQELVDVGMWWTP